MPKSAILYAYKYSYIELKRTILSVFKDKVKIVGILNLLYWIPRTLLNKFKKALAPIDFLIKKIPFCNYLLAHLFLVDCTKSDNTKTKDK